MTRSALVQAITLEQILTHPAAFGLITASAMQRAVCRIADGRALGDVACDDVRAAVGSLDELPTVRPLELLLLSAIRSGKSLLAAALAVRATQTVDLSGLGPGETARVSVLSLTTDLGRVVFDHLVGNVMAKPLLRGLLVGEPSTDTVVLRHPCGRPVEIKVVAGARAGASLVARWSAGVIFDEAPRMLGEEDGVVNFDDARRAVLGRLLPGAQLVAIGSPWAPRGPIYEMVQERWKKPSRELVVIRAPGPSMNPVWWTPERVEQLRRHDEQTYRTDVLGEFADPESSLISSGEVERATRATPLELPPADRADYVATMDPGTRGNAWTLVIATSRRLPTGRVVKVIVLAKQWQGSKTDPLSPAAVLKEIAGILKRYRLEHAWSDQHAFDAHRDLAGQQGLALSLDTMTAARKVELFERLRSLLADGEVELPPDPQVRADLLSVRKRVTLGGTGVAIELPRTADGRHADYAPAIALAIARCPGPVDERPREPEHGTAEWYAAEERKLLEQVEREERMEWWERESA